MVDIGANPIDGDPPYKAMLGRRLCTVTGFEPQVEALAALNARKSDLETYLPDAVGDGTDGTLRITHAPGMTSLFEPNPAVLNCFNGFPIWGKVVKTLPMSTRRLDDIAEIAAFDMLKIDVQGSELRCSRAGGSGSSGSWRYSRRCRSSRFTRASRCWAISTWSCAARG